MIYLKNVSTLQFLPEKCTGCGICVDVCPHAVFVITDEHVTVKNRDMCMECGACEMNCLSGALKVSSGVGCAAAILHSISTGGEPICGCSQDDETLSGCC